MIQISVYQMYELLFQSVPYPWGKVSNGT